MTRTMCTHPDTAKAEVGISLSTFFSYVSQFKIGMEGCVCTKLCYSQVFSTSLTYKCEGVIHMIAFNFFVASSYSRLRISVRLQAKKG